MQFIDGGVTAPEGFTANGIHSGLKESRRTNDTALIFCDTMCNTAGIFTQNKAQAECVKYTRQVVATGKAQAAVCNVCYANACTGEQGYSTAVRMAASVSAELAKKGITLPKENIIVCSTGIIGQQVPVEKIEQNMPLLVQGLSKEGHKEARTAIMTTDTQFKECAVETKIAGKTVRIGCMCKGSGMIHINMGTMLSFVTTDCAITPQMLHQALLASAAKTYNCVSVDGDTSTNDSLCILANGMAGNAESVAIGNAFQDERDFEQTGACAGFRMKEERLDGDGIDGSETRGDQHEVPHEPDGLDDIRLAACVGSIDGRLTEDGAAMIAKLADGGMRDAITMMDKCLSYSDELTIENVVNALGLNDYSTMFELTTCILDNNGYDIISTVESIHSAGKDLKIFIKSYMQFLLDVNKYLMLGDFKFVNIPSIYKDELDEFDGDWERDRLRSLLSTMLKLNSDIKWDNSPKHLIEATLLLEIDNGTDN